MLSESGTAAGSSASPWQQQPLATTSSAHGEGGIEIVVPRARSTPSPLPSSSPPRRRRRRRLRHDTDAAAALSREASQEDLLILQQLVESSTRKLYLQEQQQNEIAVNKKTTDESSSSSHRNKAKVFVESTAAAKKQQKQQRRSTPKRTSAKKKQEKEQRAPTAGTKPWFLRFLGCKSGASSQVIHSAHSRNDARSSSNSSSSKRREVEAKTAITTPASLSSSQDPLSSPEKVSPPLEKKKKNTGATTRSPRRSLAGSSSTASSSSAAKQQQPPSIRRSRNVTRSSTQSSHVSTRSSQDDGRNNDDNDDDDERRVDPHESIVEALVRRLEQMDAAESSAATSSGGGGGGVNLQHCSTSSQGMSHAAANSQAATQPIDNRQKAQQNNAAMIPPAAVVKAVQSPSAVSSLAHEQSSTYSGPLRHLSTVEENNLEEILSIPSSWSRRPPPVEVTLNPNHYQQNLSLSMSASESEAEHESSIDDDEEKDGGQAAAVQEEEPPQSQPSHDQSKNSKDSSSSIHGKGQEVVADPSWYGVSEAKNGIVAAAATSIIIKDSFDRELQEKQDNLRRIHTNKKSTADEDDYDEPTAAAASTPQSSPVKKSASSRSDQDTSFKSIKASVETNYMRLVETKQGRNGSLVLIPETSRDCSSERGKDHQTSAAAAVAAAGLPPPPSSSSSPPKQLAQQPPSPTQSISNSSQSSTPLAAAAAASPDPSNTAPSTKSLQTELHDQLQLLQQPHPQHDEARGSSQPPVPHRRSRIESKLIAENDDGIEAVAVEDCVWDVVQASDDDADQKYQSPVSTTMSPISTMSCSEDEGGRSTWTEEEEEVEGNETNETDDDVEGHGSASKERSRRAKKMARRKKHYDEIQKKRRQAAIRKTREDGWEGWGLHDEQKLASSNVISWDSNSYNRPVRVNAKRSKGVMKAPVRMKPPVAPKQDGWFTFNALMTTRSLEAAESGTDTAPSLPRGQRRESRRSKRRSNDELMDDDFFSDTDSDNRPEQDLPLLIKRLTNQHFRKTVSMISREFSLSMTSPDDQHIVAHMDSDISSEYDATGGEEEEDSTFFSHTDSAATSESGSRDSFFTDEKKEMEDVDLVNSSAKIKPSTTRNDHIVKWKSGWSAASALGMNDYVCAPSREEILSMSGDSDA